MNEPRTSTADVAVRRMARDGAAESTRDTVVVEEPLEIRAGGVGAESLLVTMRTPGQDFDLARGLLFTERFVEAPGDVVGVAYCDTVPVEARGNVVVAALRDGVDLERSRTARATLMSAACGVCGKATLESIAATDPPVGRGPVLLPATILALPAAMRAAQPVFERTGGLHAAALFAADGTLLTLREDVGRHNAVDKVIGEAMRFGLLPLAESILMLSGRAGFELVQKARRAGIPVIGSVSAPSTLAIELARDGNQTLVCFVRGDRFNVYSGTERISG